MPANKNVWSERITFCYNGREYYVFLNIIDQNNLMESIIEECSNIKKAWASSHKTEVVKARTIVWQGRQMKKNKVTMNYQQLNWTLMIST